ncbi:MAG: murein biosynthesis integral membrane protein MurJ [Spirochaetes bacterium]|nr:murein biosynthesis integral membrane protein MurJ [Spirochaetota bacterium]
MAPGSASHGERGGRFAYLVAAGIFLSRIFGLVRDRVFAHYFGNSAAADAFRAAFRIPNLLQNLFGEGVLSASFIPVYANLLARNRKEEADRVAGAVAAILALITSCLVLAGILAAPYLVAGIAPGFSGEKRQVTVALVKVLFPGAGMLVMSAWCLGILNSHRRFFISYAAPVIWNLSLIVTLLVFGPLAGDYNLAVILAWGSVAGSFLQFAIQLPLVLVLARGIRLSLGRRIPGVRTVLVNFLPVFVSRGVVQISAFIDELLASLLPTGAVAAFSYAQTLYTLPVSLFGMSVSAAELPLMSSAVGSDGEVAAQLRTRLQSGLARIAFFIVPSAVAFLAFGDVVAGAIYQTGRFGRGDAVYVWGILAGSSVGLLASTLGRLYSSAFYALKDTKTPFRFALIRVALSTLGGIYCALYLPAALGIEARWGVAGLTASAGLAGWVEFSLLRMTLNRRIGATGIAPTYLLRLWGAALAGAAAGWSMKYLVGSWHPALSALLVLGLYGSLYFAVAALLGVEESRRLLGRIASPLRRRP